MMQEKVIAAQVKITNAGQVKHFQVRLPKDTKTIIGIEYGIGIISRVKYKEVRDVRRPIEIDNSFLSFNRSLLMGELKLQSCEEANIFYSTHVQTDENLGQGDFSKTWDWIPSPYTHQGKTEEDIVMVNGDSTIVNGVYKDKIGELYRIDFEYLLNVYVWVKVESSEEKGENK